MLKVITMLKGKLYPIIAVGIILLACFITYKISYNKGIKDGYNDGYNAGYSKGYSDGYEDRNKLTDNSTVKTETKVVYQKVPYSGADVKVNTEPPKVTVEVNGKKQEIIQKQETADLAVKTETEVKIKVPEKRWSIGVGYSDDKSVGYMLKAPLKVGKNSDNLGLWIAGSGKKRIMGGVSISF